MKSYNLIHFPFLVEVLIATMGCDSPRAHRSHQSHPPASVMNTKDRHIKSNSDGKRYTLVMYFGPEHAAHPIIYYSLMLITQTDGPMQSTHPGTFSLSRMIIQYSIPPLTAKFHSKRCVVPLLDYRFQMALRERNSTRNGNVG